MRRCPRSSKKLRYRSRISSEVITLRILGVACAQRWAAILACPTTCSPSYRQAICPGAVRSIERSSRTRPSRCSPGEGLPSQAAGVQPAVGAHAHAVDAAALAQQGQLPQRQLVGQQRRPRADRDRVRGRVGVEHVQGPGTGEAEPVSLADGEQVAPGVLAELHAVLVGDRPRAPAEAAVAAAGSAPGRCPRGSTGPGSRGGGPPPARSARPARGPRSSSSSRGGSASSPGRPPRGRSARSSGPCARRWPSAAGPPR